MRYLLFICYICTFCKILKLDAIMALKEEKTILASIYRFLYNQVVKFINHWMSIYSFFAELFYSSVLRCGKLFLKDTYWKSRLFIYWDCQYTTWEVCTDKCFWSSHITTTDTCCTIRGVSHHTYLTGFLPERSWIKTGINWRIFYYELKQ